MYNQLDLNYIAGIMDGESTFFIAKRKKNGYTQYSSVFSLSMIDEYAVKLISSIFNLPYSIRPSPLNGKKVYHLYVSARKAEDLSEVMIPYLRIKTNQAKCLLEFRNLRNNKKKYLVTKNYKILHAKYGGDRMIPNKVPSQEYFDLCESIRLKCKSLK